MSECVAIVYGRGGSLGSFAVLARDIAKRLADGRAASPSGTYDRGLIYQTSIERRAAFFAYLKDPPFKGTHKIKELHILSHSIGGGLFLAYQDPAVVQGRVDAIARAATAGRNVRYGEALATEVGAILVDDFIRAPFAAMQSDIRNNLAANGLVKIWGCNSAIAGWVYTDNGIVDPADSRVVYYWRALNEENRPKPSVAQAFADYFGVKTLGAAAGAHIEVLHRNQWVTSARYKAQIGQWPSGTLEHRLAPDRGSYGEFSPTP